MGENKKLSRILEEKYVMCPFINICKLHKMQNKCSNYKWIECEDQKQFKEMIYNE